MTWTAYHYHGATDHDDPTKYENQVRQTGRFTASVWVVHMDVLAPQVERVLDAIEYFAGIANTDVLTGEYAVERRDSSRWVRLSVYYRASRVVSAATIGRSLARAAFGGWGGVLEDPAGDYSITPAGNWDDVVVDARLPKGVAPTDAQLPKRERGNGPEAEDAQGPA